MNPRQSESESEALSTELHALINQYFKSKMILSYFLIMSRQFLYFRRHYFPPWNEDKNLILAIIKKNFNSINKVEVARLYIRYCQIKEAYLIIEFLKLLIKYKQISKKWLFKYTREIHKTETIYFSGNIPEAKEVKPKQYKPTKKELLRSAKYQRKH